MHRDVGCDADQLLDEHTHPLHGQLALPQQQGVHTIQGRGHMLVASWERQPGEGGQQVGLERLVVHVKDPACT
jgi:hypothetical protein